MISVTFEEKSLAVDDCHPVTSPVFPVKVRVTLLIPETKVLPPEIVPPTEIGLIERLALSLVSTGHDPLCITAL